MSLSTKLVITGARCDGAKDTGCPYLTDFTHADAGSGFVPPWWSIEKDARGGWRHYCPSCTEERESLRCAD